MFGKIFRLAPRGERRGLFYRLLSGSFLPALSAMLASAATLLSYAVYFLVDPKVTPVELYHNTWKVARDNLYDQSKLKDWEQWEHKYDDQIKTEADALRYAQEMIASLNESYTGLLTVEIVERDKKNADGRYVGIGVVVDLVDGHPMLKKVIDGGPAQEAGLKDGDQVVALDGIDTSTWNIEQMAEALKGKEGEPLTLTVRRASLPASSQMITVTLKRSLVQSPIVRSNDSDSPAAAPVDAMPQPVSDTPVSGRVGYLRIDSFTQWSTSKQVEDSLKRLSNCDALVIDLRDNPGGFIHEAVRTASLFIESGVLTNLRIRVPKGGYMTTQVSVTPSQIWLDNSYGILSHLNIPLFHRRPYLLNGRPVVILVNGNTASAAEMFTAALVENGVATVIGTTTFGKGIGQTYIPVGNGHKLRITHLHSFTPEGHWLGDAGQTVSNGIKPSIELNKEGFGAYGTGADNQFQEAVRFLENKLKSR